MSAVIAYDASVSAKTGSKGVLASGTAIVCYLFRRRKEDYYGAHLGGHRGYCYALVKGHLVNGITVKLNAVTQQGVGSVNLQQVQDHVLGSHSFRQSSR